MEAKPKRQLTQAQLDQLAKAQEKAMKFHSLDNAENGIKKRT